MTVRGLGALIAAALCAGLLGCAGKPPLAADDQPTLASLNTRQPQLPAPMPLQVDQATTIEAYRRFIDIAVDVPQRAEALRRLGDLEMDAADRRSAAATDGAPPDYRLARRRYEDYLRTYPQGEQRDRVLYQLARAQEQVGELEATLKTLTQLVKEHPGTLHATEAQFRRGEMLFATRDYAGADAAYTDVLAATPGPLAERSLYMQGWSRYKLGRLEEGLQSFFKVLDLKLGGLPPVPRDEADLAAIRQLTRADRELVEDTFRVMSISLASLQGAAAIAPYIAEPIAPGPVVARQREGYQFRVYQQLADLYLRQGRIKDAADALGLFVQLEPLHTQAPALLVQVVDIYTEHGFALQALQAKRRHVEGYGAGAQGRDFARLHPAASQDTQPRVKTHLADLARHFHGVSQKTHAVDDVDEAAHWYQELLAQFPDAPDVGQSHFLYGELLFENRRWADAARMYEIAAYADDKRPVERGGYRNAEAAYGALLCYAELEKNAATLKDKRGLLQQSVASGLRFTQIYADDARRGAVQVRAAEQLLALGEGDSAVSVAQRALALTPVLKPELRRAAFNVLAQQASKEGDHLQAEAALGEVLALTGADAGARREIAEQRAAAIYRQGEAARREGDMRTALKHFERAAAQPGLAVDSAVRASAQFDAATEQIELKDWSAAVRTLEDFRRQQPGHALQAAVAPKLALAYLALGQSAAAAGEFERVAAQAAQEGKPELARSAAWQAAELHEKAAAGTPPRSAARGAAIRAYERVLQQVPPPTGESAVETRWRLATLNQQDGQTARATDWLKDLQQVDAAAGTARTPRMRTLAGLAALTLAEPLADSYRTVALVEPLANQLRIKKERFEAALAAYARAAEVGITEVSTEATLRSASLYADFGRALIASARPRNLKKAELEQYNVMLEEQAFPFEERAIELHESNARRAAAGTYDEAVKKSYAELARLKPARWGKTERADDSLPRDVVGIDAALATFPKGDWRRAPLLNQLGIALRRLGRFEEARQSYEAAIGHDAKALAPQINLAILLDLYLDEPARAATLYQHCLELAGADEAQLKRWLAELKNRKAPATAAVARP